MEVLHHQGAVIALIAQSTPIITDAQTALNAAMDACYSAGTRLLCIDKRAVCRDFFVLSTGLAGEVLQKFTNYHIHVAFYGDFTHYTSKPLRDFIRESNQGNSVFFAATREEALDRLAQVSA